jgi:alpha-ketoglutarate-dependent taurine dioxygenase
MKHHDALLSLAARYNAEVLIDGTQVYKGGAASPLLVVVTTPDSALPAIAPDRRALIMLAPGDLVTVSNHTNGLIALTQLTLRGTSTFAKRHLCLDVVGTLDMASITRDTSDVEVLVERHGQPLVCRVGLHCYVASIASFSNRLLAAESNSELVTYALTGSIDAAAVTYAHSWSRDVTKHAAPLTLNTSLSEWSMPKPPSTPVGSAEFTSAVRRASRALPESVHGALLEFADESHPSGALLVRGIPIGDLPHTPPTTTTPSAKSLVSEQVLLAAGRVLGQPIGYLPEHGGDIIQNLIPTRDGAYRQVSTSSAVTLAWHTEAAFHPHRPRFLLLLCLRGDPAARTTLCSIHEVVEALSLRTRWLLSEPLYRTAVDESYTGSRSQQLGPLVPVLSGDLDAPRMVFDADLMTGVSAEATSALAELTALIEAHHTYVVLQAGDLLVVDNSRAVHGRSPFTPRFDGTDRWLQRTFVVSDLAASAGERQGRVISTRFHA